MTSIQGTSIASLHSARANSTYLTKYHLASLNKQELSVSSTAVGEPGLALVADPTNPYVLPIEPWRVGCADEELHGRGVLVQWLATCPLIHC